MNSCKLQFQFYKMALHDELLATDISDKLRITNYQSIMGYNKLHFFYDFKPEFTKKKCHFCLSVPRSLCITA